MLLWIPYKPSWKLRYCFIIGIHKFLQDISKCLSFFPSILPSSPFNLLVQSSVFTHELLKFADLSLWVKLNFFFPLFNSYLSSIRSILFSWNFSFPEFIFKVYFLFHDFYICVFLLCFRFSSTWFFGLLIQFGFQYCSHFPFCLQS